MNTAAPRVTGRRSSWNYVTHIAPLAIGAAIPLTLISDAFGSPFDDIGSFVVLGMIVVVILGSIRHGKGQCARCKRIAARDGADGAVKRAVFIRLFHHIKPLSLAAFMFLAIGVGLSFWLDSYGVAWAAWPARIGMIGAYLVMALLEYSWVSHVIYSDFCRVEEHAADAAE